MRSLQFAMLVFLMALLTNCATVTSMSCDQYCGKDGLSCSRDGYAEFKDHWSKQKASVSCFGKVDCAKNKAKKERYWEAMRFGVENRYTMYQCSTPRDAELNKVQRHRKSAEQLKAQKDKEYEYINDFVRFLYKYGLWI